jgi:hypothetical protein
MLPTEYDATAHPVSITCSYRELFCPQALTLAPAIDVLDIRIGGDEGGAPYPRPMRVRRLLRTQRTAVGKHPFPAVIGLDR